MAKKVSSSESSKIFRELERATIDLHKATEEYLHAALGIARLHGKKVFNRVAPHVLNIAKSADNLHKKRRK